jgi:adenylate kinase family enzyme
MKIAIIGSPGSGKSTLALQLHKILNIPLFHLDQYYWKPDWQVTDHDEFAKIHNAVCDTNSWIIEGMVTSLFAYRLERADIIIFLDIPLYICLYRIFKRAFLNFGKVSFAAAPGCRERIPHCHFLRHVWSFHREEKLEIEKLLHTLKEYKKIFIIKNQSDLDGLIKKFERAIRCTENSFF